MGDFAKVTAIIALAVIEITALSKGIDGVYLTLVVGAISGLVGYEMGKKT